MKHKQSHEIEFANGSRITFHVSEGELTFVGNLSKSPIPLSELSAIAGVCNGAVTTGKTRRRRREREPRAHQVPREMEVVWNRKCKTDPSAMMEPSSLQARVAHVAFKLARRPIQRSTLTARIVSETKLPEKRVSYTVSHLIHGLKMLRPVVR